MEGRRIKDMRTRLGLTQAQLSALSFISATDISAYERGVKQVPPGDGERLESVFGMFAGSTVGTPNEAMQALGQAVLMLDETQREELYRKAGEQVALLAIAEHTVTRINGTVAQELERTRRELQDTRDELNRIRGVLA